MTEQLTHTHIGIKAGNKSVVLEKQWDWMSQRSNANPPIRSNSMPPEKVITPSPSLVKASVET